MNKTKLQHTLLAVALVMGIGQTGISNAHGVAGPIDPHGDVASFTAVAKVTCFDDGNGKAAYLAANIKDLPSNPVVEDMFVHITLFKGDSAISITDTIPGDDSFSPSVQLNAGEGLYFMIVSKTKAGGRSVAVDYHCMTADHVHTGTDFNGVSHYE